MRQYYVIKTENEDLEKQVNNSSKTILLKPYITRLIFITFLLFGAISNAQNDDKLYTLAEVIVSGDTNYSSGTIVTFSGLRKGETLRVPGDKTRNALNKLWKTNLFSSVNLYVTKIEADSVYLEIELYDLPQLNEALIEGVKKGKKEDVITENKLQPGVKVTENLITTTKNYIENTYKKRGFLNAKVNITTQTVIDTLKSNKVNLKVNISKGSKIKVKKIVFVGNDKLSGKKLRKAMKNTKQKNLINILKRSKYIKEDFKET